MQKTKYQTLSLSLILVSGLSYGEISFNGFATMAAGKTGGSDETIYGYDDYLTYEQGSLLGLQAATDLGDGLEATVQIKAEGAEDWVPEFEWAYLSYVVNDNIKVFFGRQRQPFYIYSDYLDVGYAYHWVEPPRGVYDLPFDSNDGLSVLFTNTIGKVDSNVQLVIGRNKSTFTLQGEETSIDTKDSVGLNWTLAHKGITFRVGHTQAKLDLGAPVLDQIVSGWEQTAAQLTLDGQDTLATTATAIANDMNALQYREADASFSGVGLTIDMGPILFVAEATKLDLSDGFIGETNSRYASLGYRVTDAFMIHLTLGEDDDEGESIEIDAALQPTEIGVGTQALFDNFISEESYETVGIRWDFHPSAAFKLQYTNRENELASDEDASVIVFAVSTVF